MKLFKTTQNNKVVLALLLSLLFVSCNEYLDVDTDKDNPNVAPINYLLTSTQIGLSDITAFQDFSGGILEVYTHQMTARNEQDQYGTKVNNTLVGNDWNNIYLTLNNVETLIKQATESNDLLYVGIGQIEKAYIMSVAVDLWGDVPYSEAGNLKGGVVSPKFDNQKEIYKAIFQLIDLAKTNLSSGTGDKPTTNDLIYKGDIEKWIRFTNTFKLKLYNQVRLTTDFDQAGYTALINDDNFFKSLEDDFQFLHTKTTSPRDERNTFFLESYNSSQFETYMSPWFYEIMMGMNPNIHTSNKDPRIEYYFYKQLKAGEFPPDLGDVATGNPKADYWDAATGFYSIRFGSQGPWRDFSAEKSYTYPGIFPAGGRYDDGKGGPMSAATATGIAPHRMLTYDEFLYIQAELIQENKLAGDASAKLKEAMEASFKKVDDVVSKNESQQSIPKLIGDAKTDTFISNIISEFNSASNTKKLELIMTQKWVATFGDPADQYNDYRRTGYPILANPKSTSKEYQLDNGDAFPIDDSETTVNNPYQLSLYWPQTEINVNKNAPKQKTPGTYKIFWDN